MLEQNQHDAGFRSSVEPETEQEQPQPKMVRLSEIRQLVVPYETALPEEMQSMAHRASDLVELGHIIYEAEKNEAPVIILQIADSVLMAAVQYPTLLRLKAAVVKGIPGTDYSPMFNQAAFGLNDVSWGYLVDALQLDDRLQFDLNAETQARKERMVENLDDASFNP